jgi:hypothetical protein
MKNKYETYGPQAIEFEREIIESAIRRNIEEGETDWGVGDTEDDSKELLESGRSGFEKTVTQVAFILANGTRRFFGKGEVYRARAWIEQCGVDTFYFHNLQYDLGNLFADDLDDLDTVLVGGRLIRARWNGITFLDSFNIYPMSAKKLGEAIGVRKFEMDLSNEEYVYRDCEIVLVSMSNVRHFAQEMGVAKLPSTLGGLAVKIFGAMNLKNVYDTNAFSRSALFGGRVELFHKGGMGNIFYCDINSLYPSVMRNEFPGELLLRTGRQAKDLSGYGIADVDIDIPACEVAPLPSRREDGSVYYPCGALRGTWTYHEINNAIEYCGARVKKVHENWGSEKGYRFYRSFVETLYFQRKNAPSEAWSLLLKLTLNNLYGQLAIGGTISRSMLLGEEPLQTGDIVYGKRKLGKHQIPFPPHSNFTHGSYVTSYGRLEYFRHARLVSDNGGTLIYGDTDGIIFFWPERKELPFPISTELGEMKLEKKASCAYTFAPKMYQVDQDYKAKGVRKSQAKEFIENGSVVSERPYKMREAIAFFDRDNARKLSTWFKFTKNNNAKYDKKILKGKRYYPIMLKPGSSGN